MNILFLISFNAIYVFVKYQKRKFTCSIPQCTCIKNKTVKLLRIFNKIFRGHLKSVTNFEQFYYSRNRIFLLFPALFVFSQISIQGNLFNLRFAQHDCVNYTIDRLFGFFNKIVQGHLNILMNFQQLYYFEYDIFAQYNWAHVLIIQLTIV